MQQKYHRNKNITILRL